jgi:SAM-dependent methyltransferase
VPAEDDEAESAVRRLKSDWEQRARSPSRDYFVAAHPGWDDPEQRERQAQQDAAFMLQDLAMPLASADVLEIGCGIGRLVPYVAPRALSYTGLDFAAPMLEEARRRHGALPNVRFLESDGLHVPPAARDRCYQLVFAMAVLIHCPREVVAVLVADAWKLVSGDGELRLQLRAAEADASGELRRTLDLHASTGLLAVPASDHALLQEGFMGAAFQLAEVVPFLRGLTAGDVTAVRADPLIYAAVRRHGRRAST